MQKNTYGKVGEIIATNYLKQKGYKIIANNYKNPIGEIDIIAQDTIEQDIINALVNKNDIATTVLRDTPVAWLTKILLNK